MYSRLLKSPQDKSFFLFGPRGTGKSSWAHANLGKSLYFDLLESSTFIELVAAPDRLDMRIPLSHKGWVVIDEVQRIPELLNEVHRLIESRKLKFALTGSSARKLRRRGVNLLAGRALSYEMHPLTAFELGEDFRLERSLRFGNLPAAQIEADPKGFLASYVTTYLREEVLQEGLTRNLAAFSRFLEAASFSQACVLNISAVARDCAVERKVVEAYFGILDDLLLAVRLTPFKRRAKRKIVEHPKFYFFDVGLFRSLRPRGPLDSESDLLGPSLETLVLEELRAHNAASHLDYQLHYWRTAAGDEVDFVLYGERGLRAIEVKASSRLRTEDFSSLETFLSDYPMAHATLVYLGRKPFNHGPIEVQPAYDWLPNLGQILK
jgi:predicted AAA+ superfamily ATPase